MTTQHTESLKRLETLAAENATLKLQLKQARGQVRLLREELAETLAIAEGAAWREQQWPNSLNTQQKLHQAGMLLAQLFVEPEVAPAVKEIFGDALEQLTRCCQTQQPSLLQALTARHLFPQIALALAKQPAAVVNFSALRKV